MDKVIKKIRKVGRFDEREDGKMNEKLINLFLQLTEEEQDQIIEIAESLLSARLECPAPPR